MPQSTRHYLCNNILMWCRTEDASIIWVSRVTERARLARDEMAVPAADLERPAGWPTRRQRLGRVSQRSGRPLPVVGANNRAFAGGAETRPSVEKQRRSARKEHAAWFSAARTGRLIRSQLHCNRSVDGFLFLGKEYLNPKVEYESACLQGAVTPAALPAGLKER